MKSLNRFVFTQNDQAQKMNDSINSSIAWSINAYAFVLFHLSIALSVLVRFVTFSASQTF